MGICNCSETIVAEEVDEKSTDSEVVLGPMKLKQRSMSILLVFAREDSQSDAFWWAAEKGSYKCNIARNPEGALESFLSKHHDVVIIDHRYNKSFDAEALCRSIRATKASEHTLLVAVTKKFPPDKDEPSILPLLKTGFNKRFPENHNVGACYNELLQLEYGELRSRTKLRALNAMVHALDNVSDSVEISNEDHEIQYVNPAYERLTGFSMEEVAGKDSRELKSERNKPDLQETINGQLKKGKRWEGTYYTRRKSGDPVPQHCCICPVSTSGGKPSHYVSIRSSHLDTSHYYDMKLKDSDYYSQIANGGIHTVARRRESFARIHSMTIEAPITKVINIINAAQENSPITVVQALDKVLEILRTSELYSPYFAQDIKDDDMTSDYLGGLVSQDVKRHLKESAEAHTIGSKPSHQVQTHIPSSHSSLTTQLPENIHNLLVKEADWDFDIIQLEKVTNKRPLVYLGIRTMSRFDVCGFLNISETVLSNWLTMIEMNYHGTNPYHNSTHAADVLNGTAYFLEREKLKAIFEPVDEVASLIAAVVHDVDHPGKSNAFLTNAGSELAILYNDLAVLESHHVALSFKLTCQDDKFNIFKNLDRDTYRVLRQSIIDMVLATEMMKHFEHLNKFVNSINKMTQKAEETSSVTGSCSPDSASIISQLATPENKVLIKRMLIKCADVANPCRPVDLCIEWAKRIAEEYCQQTDEEKKLSLPVVMPVFDRKTCSLPKSQTSFIDFFINDMFDAWDYFCDIPDLITHLQNNYQYWKDEEESPTVNYDLSGQGQKNNTKNNDNGTSKNLETVENISGDNT